MESIPTLHFCKRNMIQFCDVNAIQTYKNTDPVKNTTIFAEVADSIKNILAYSLVEHIIQKNILAKVRMATPTYSSCVC